MLYNYKKEKLKFIYQNSCSNFLFSHTEVFRKAKPHFTIINLEPEIHVLLFPSQAKNYH